MVEEDFGVGVAIDPSDENRRQLVTTSISNGRVVVAFPTAGGIGRMHQEFFPLLWIQCEFGRLLTVVNYRPNYSTSGQQSGLFGFADWIFDGLLLEAKDFENCLAIELESSALYDFFDTRVTDIHRINGRVSASANFHNELLDHELSPCGRLAIQIDTTLHGRRTETAISERLVISLKDQHGVSLKERQIVLAQIDQLAVILTGVGHARLAYECTFEDQTGRRKNCKMLPQTTKGGAERTSHGSRRITQKKLGISTTTLLRNWLSLAHVANPSVSLFERWHLDRSHNAADESDLLTLINIHEIFFNRTKGDDGQKLHKKLRLQIEEWLPLFGIKNSTEFCQDLANSRNWLSHFNPSNDVAHKDRTYANLHTYCKLLELVYVCVVLRELKVEAQVVANLLKDIIAENNGYFLPPVLPMKPHSVD